MFFIDAITAAAIAPGEAFQRIYAHNGRSAEVLAAADRLDSAMFGTNDADEAADAAEFLDVTACELELAGMDAQ